MLHNHINIFEMRTPTIMIFAVLLAGCDLAPMPAAPTPPPPKPQDPLPTGAAALSWVAPTAYTDGTKIVQLEGFRIYYSQDRYAVQTQQAESVTVAVTESLMMEELNLGTWHFAVTAIDSLGTEGLQSDIVSKNIDGTVPNTVICDTDYIMGRYQISCG